MKKSDDHKKIKKNITTNEPVIIDKTDFEGSILIDPIIVYNGESFSFENTRVFGNVTFQTENETVKNTIELLDFLGFLSKDFSDNWKRDQAE